MQPKFHTPCAVSGGALPAARELSWCNGWQLDGLSKEDLKAGREPELVAMQRWLTRYWLAHPDDVAIDAYGEIFLSLFDVDAAHLALADAPATASAAAAAADGECAAPAFDVACNASGFAVSPCVIHGNGGTKNTPVYRAVAERVMACDDSGP